MAGACLITRLPATQAPARMTCSSVCRRWPGGNYSTSITTPRDRSFRMA